MGRFYFYFQWVGLLLVPGLLIFGLGFMSGTLNIEVYQIVLATLIGGLLILTAFYTSRSQKTLKKKRLSKRIVSLLEPVYGTTIALLFTGGASSTDVGNLSPLVAILTSRDSQLQDALTVNSVVQSFLFTAVFLFALTVTLVAFRERLAQQGKHYSAERYDIVYDTALTDDEKTQFETNSTDNPPIILDDIKNEDIK